MKLVDWWCPCGGRGGNYEAPAPRCIKCSASMRQGTGPQTSEERIEVLEAQLQTCMKAIGHLQATLRGIARAANPTEL